MSYITFVPLILGKIANNIFHIGSFNGAIGRNERLTCPVQDAACSMSRLADVGRDRLQ